MMMKMQIQPPREVGKLQYLVTSRSVKAVLESHLSIMEVLVDG